MTSSFFINNLINYGDKAFVYGLYDAFREFYNQGLKTYYRVIRLSSINPKTFVFVLIKIINYFIVYFCRTRTPYDPIHLY